MPIKVLAFAGSPRRNGNSETLLDWVLDAMRREETVDVEKIVLIDANINPCMGCNACEVLNKCIQRDGMDILHDKIIEADVIILAAPIFCMGICSQAKALIDRFQVYFMAKYIRKSPLVIKEKRKSRLGLYLGISGMNLPYVFDGAKLTIHAFFDIIDVKYWDDLLIRDMDTIEDLTKRPEFLEEAYKKGRELGRLLAGKEMIR
mgnify:CR=1 FL=1